MAGRAPTGPDRRRRWLNAAEPAAAT